MGRDGDNSDIDEQIINVTTDDIYTKISVASEFQDFLDDSANLLSNLRENIFSVYGIIDRCEGADNLPERGLLEKIIRSSEHSINALNGLTIAKVCANAAQYEQGMKQIRETIEYVNKFFTEIDGYTDTKLSVGDYDPYALLSVANLMASSIQALNIVLSSTVIPGHIPEEQRDRYIKTTRGIHSYNSEILVKLAENNDFITYDGPAALKKKETIRGPEVA